MDETTAAPSIQAPVAQAPSVRAQANTERRDTNIVYIGKKSVMGYVLAVVTQFNSGESEVFIKARGKMISHAVDVAEIVRHRFMPGVRIDGILTKTEELDSEDGTKSKVSAIEIKLVK